MDHQSLVSFAQAKLTEKEQLRPNGYTTEELLRIWKDGNERGPTRPSYEDSSIVNIVDAQARWKEFCKFLGHQDWRALLKTLSYDNKGLLNTFMLYLLAGTDSKGSNIGARSTIKRYMKQTWTIYKKYSGNTIDSRLVKHSRVFLNSQRERFPLRTEPKLKNHVGPDAFIYLAYFRWVRDNRTQFKIGLDRLDDATLRQFQMFTGGRTHEFVFAGRKNMEAKRRAFHDKLDAFTDDEDDLPANFKQTLRQKECWVCGNVDDRTIAEKKVLCWEDIKFWIVQDPYENGGRDRLVMTVLLRFHKGHKKEHRPTKFIFVEEDLPLICPVSHILAKALSEGVIANEGFSRPEHFFRTRLSERGAIFTWKEEFRHLPVFRQTVRERGGFIKSRSPLTRYTYDNRTVQLGKRAGFPNNLNSYDMRRGMLETINMNCEPTVRRQIARHKGDRIFEEKYNNARINVVTQDAFLGRGTKSPYLAIFNQLGLQCDENAPTRAPDEMMRDVEPSAEIQGLERELSALVETLEQQYGRISLAEGDDKEKYEALRTKMRAARQRQRRHIEAIARQNYFVRKNDEELQRQLNGQHLPRAALQPVTFILPERRRIAEILGDLEDEISEEEMVQKKIDAVTAWVDYAWKAEVKEPMVQQGASPNVKASSWPDKKAFSDEARKPRHSRLIREVVAVPPRPEEPCSSLSPPSGRVDTKSNLDQQTSSDLAIETHSGGHGHDIKSRLPNGRERPSPCIFCGQPFTRRTNMWKHVEVHIRRMGIPMLCPSPGCEEPFDTVVSFKCHVFRKHGVRLKDKVESLRPTGKSASQERAQLAPREALLEAPLQDIQPKPRIIIKHMPKLESAAPTSKSISEQGPLDEPRPKPRIIIKRTSKVESTAPTPKNTLQQATQTATQETTQEEAPPGAPPEAPPGAPPGAPPEAPLEAPPEASLDTRHGALPVLPKRTPREEAIYNTRHKRSRFNWAELKRGGML